VGELAYNAERVLALEEQGHKLLRSLDATTVLVQLCGPLPFGHVEDIRYEIGKKKLKG
jgi:hypothetical protein